LAVKRCSYLKEEAEADPLVVLVVATLVGVKGLVNSGMRDINADPLPEGTGYRVRRVDPAVRIEHILWDVFCVNTVYGVAHVLSCGHYERERQQAHDSERVVEAEDGAVDVDMADLGQVLQTPEHVQHFGS